MNPKIIKRIGIAVEFADGSRAMVYSDDDAAQVEVETVREYEELFCLPQSMSAITGSRTSITISDLGRYSIHHSPAPDVTAGAVEGIKRQIEGEKG